MLKKLIINYLGREKRYALLEDKKIEKLVIEQPRQESFVGSIFLGTVTKVLPGMNAAFVDIGLDKNGYLHRDSLPAYLSVKEENKSISSLVHQGEKLLVQVEKDATGNKGPRLTGIIEFNGHSTVYMPQGLYVAVSKKIVEHQIREKWRQLGFRIKSKEEGILFRTSCQYHTEEEIFEEVEQLREKYRRIMQAALSMKRPGLIVERNSFLENIQEEIHRMKAGEVAVDDPDIRQRLLDMNTNNAIQIVHHTRRENIFSTYGLEHEIEKALKKVVWLENGAYLIFDEIEALTIIDVNTGKFSGRSNLRDTVVKTNEWAAVEIARQIRLRDIGGIILIDFIDMKEAEDRERVLKTVEDSLAEDDKRTRIVGFTPLGILQLTRKRTRVSITESLTTRCEACEGTGRVLSPETVAFQLERELWAHKGTDEEAVLIETTREVKEVFSGDQNIHQKRLEEVLGFKLHFLLKEFYKPYYHIRQFGSNGNIEKKLLDIK